jgi:hypothetical protein
LAGVTSGFGAALSLGAIAPLAGVIAASWGALTIVHALAMAATAALALLVTAAGALLAADWRADLQSRQLWAQVNIAPAEVRLSVIAATHGDLDPRYLPGVDNEALRCLILSHRFAPRTSMLGSSKRVSASAITTSQDALIGQVVRAVPRTVPAGTTIVAASGRKAACAGRAAARARRVVNASAWRGWPGGECIVSPTPAHRHTADIIILGSRQDGQARALPEASAGSDISGSTDPPSCRGPPQAGHRSCVVGTARAKLCAEHAPRRPGAGKSPSADPIVCDNLGDQVPVCAAELDVIETYLDHVLHDVLASATGSSEQEQTSGPNCLGLSARNSAHGNRG